MIKSGRISNFHHLCVGNVQNLFFSLFQNIQEVVVTSYPGLYRALELISPTYLHSGTCPFSLYLLPPPRWPLFCSLRLWDQLFKLPHISEDTWSFCVWLLSLIVIFPRLLCVVRVAGLHSFLWLNSIPRCIVIHFLYPYNCRSIFCGWVRERQIPLPILSRFQLSK